MAKRTKYAISFAPESIEHLDRVDSKYHRLVQREIHDQLAHTPEIESRNRKHLDQPAPFDSTWELRCGPDNRFRVFYEVDVDATCVRVLAIGIKDRSRLTFGGEELTT